MTSDRGGAVPCICGGQ